MNKRNWWLITSILLALLLAGCGGGEPTADEILTQAADRMSGVETLQFAIEREGEAPVINPNLGAKMLSATGEYQSPDSVYAVVKVDANGIVAEAEVVWLGTETYFKLPPLFSSYQPLDTSESFNAAAIFDAEEGLPAILRGLDSPTLVGQEDVEGVQAHHIEATADGADLQNLVGGAVQSGPATLEVWVDVQTNDVVRAIITEESGDRWLIDFFAFGDPVEIPAVE